MIRRASNGAAAIPPSHLPPLPHSLLSYWCGSPPSLPSSSSPPQPPLLPRDAPAAAPAPTAGVFAGIHLVDSLTRSGSFAYFRIARVMPKGEAVQQIAASVHLVLDLADKYPRDSLAAHILDCVAHFLPALLSPCTRRGRVRQIISNAKRFQRETY
jgi:hypothetical protein